MIRKGTDFIIKLAVWTPILLFSGLLTHNALKYYSFELHYGILPEKVAALKDPVWTVSFYVHVIAGVVCLLIPIASFLGRKLKMPVSWHEVIGRVFVIDTIFIVAPTGMYLALYAKGGLSAQVGFLVQGILVSLFTYLGYKAIQRKDRTSHIHWMIRSYAMVLAVLTFRILHITFFFAGMKYADNYGLSQWCSIIGNLFIAELAIGYMTLKQPKLITR